MRCASCKEEVCFMVCRRCKGKGQIVRINWFFAVLTLGLTAMLDCDDPQICGLCGGSGYIHIREKQP